MRIHLDYRERKIEGLLRERLKEVLTEPLPVGDILIEFDGYGVIIERKSASDFAASIKNNRLWEQLRRMLVSRVLDVPIRRRALLIHGDIYEMIEQSGLRWSHIMGAYQDIQFNYGIPVFHAPDDEALVEFLRILILREEGGKNSGEIKELWSRAVPKKNMSDEEWRIYVLSSLPFVGEKMARNLLAQFESIERIARANISELKKVEGIGDKKARRIYRIFH